MSNPLKPFADIVNMVADKDRKIHALQATIGERDDEIKTLRLFRKYLEELLACYRTGKRPTDQCLDGLAKLRAAEAAQRAVTLPGKDGES